MVIRTLLGIEFGFGLAYAIVFCYIGLVIQGRTSRPRRAWHLSNIFVTSGLIIAMRAVATLGSKARLAALYTVCLRSLYLRFPMYVLEELSRRMFLGETLPAFRRWNSRFALAINLSRVPALLAPLLSQRPCGSPATVTAALFDAFLATIAARKLRAVEGHSLRMGGTSRQMLSRSFNITDLNKNFYSMSISFSFLSANFIMQSIEQFLLWWVPLGMWNRCCAPGLMLVSPDIPRGVVIAVDLFLLMAKGALNFVVLQTLVRSLPKSS